MPDSPIRFGTDGWRAVMSDGFTMETVAACTQAIAEHFAEMRPGSRRMVVGHDTRFMSEDFARLVAQVLAGNGFEVELADRPAPTPAISHRVVDTGATGGVVVTSSHNPATWNGIKVKPHYGGSADDETIASIEARIPAVLEDRSRIKRTAGSERIAAFNPLEGYLAGLSAFVDTGKIRSAGLSVAVDAMYGTGAGIFSELIGGGKTTVTEIHGERNPLFPGIRAPEPIAENLNEFQLLSATKEFDIGIANDGDADRVGIVDEKGNYVDQLRVFALLIEAFLGQRAESGAIVKSVTTTDMARLLAEHHGVKLFETPVGFKHIAPVMMREEALIGGEESGGFGFRGHLPERDGILAGLVLLEFMAQTGKRPSELLDLVFSTTGPHYYARRDFEIGEEQRAGIVARLDGADYEEIAGSPVIERDRVDGWRFRFEDGWLLFRLSGTEPLVRVYTEVREKSLVDDALDAGQELLGLQK